MTQASYGKARTLNNSLPPSGPILLSQLVINISMVPELTLADTHVHGYHAGYSRVLRGGRVVTYRSKSILV